jgi:hypothetical protein
LRWLVVIWSSPLIFGKLFYFVEIAWIDGVVVVNYTEMMEGKMIQHYTIMA